MSACVPREQALRFGRSDDAPAIVEAVRESLVDLLPWMSWVTADYALPQALEWLTRGATDRLDGSAFEFLIVDEADRILGCCGLNQVNHAHRFANLGYWVRTSARGRGVAVEAARQLRDWAFASTDLRRLEIVVSQGNVASERVAEKLGAVREGVLGSRLCIRDEYHDATMFSIVRGPDERMAG